ncbi:UDP-N-acetylglucosamine 2-epimerase (non-hydrolyzing) [Candidatus Shapirobacteria bacterium]|nr:UDP-N-acetylglucosamine 2-epimerase (non-hydrolyzing) [Candidatus Shapirobacteria bacterium]
MKITKPFPKIHIVIGTKAQLIKMAPIMAELQKQKIDYNFVFTGQHKETIQELIDVFGLKKPDYVLYEGKDITKISQMLIWSIKCLIKTIKNKKDIFGSDKKGIVLVHGDTFSAILGARMAKIAGLKVGTIEAGLRSFDLFNPFPEEIIRLRLSRLTDYHFCPGDFAFQNSQKYKGEKINTQINTLYDSLQLVLKNKDKISVPMPKQKYCLVSIHRFENLFNKERFDFIIKTIEKISEDIRVLFILHEPTKEKLVETGCFSRLKKNKNIELRPRYDYFKFIRLLIDSEFLVTDGGSNQEETSYLGKPCLVMRKTTERKEGVGANVIISEYSPKIIKNFVKNYPKFEKKNKNLGGSPSKIIVDRIKKDFL